MPDHEKLEGYNLSSWTKEMTNTIYTDIRLGYSTRKIGRSLETIKQQDFFLRKKFGLGSSLRICEEHKVRRERGRGKLGKPEERIIEEVGSSSDSEVIVPSSRTKTNVNVKAGVSPQVIERNNCYEVFSF